MSKEYKLKSYSKKSGFFSSRRRIRPFKTIAAILGIALCVFIGVSIYKPVVTFFGGKMQPNPIPDTVTAQSSIVETAQEESTTIPAIEEPEVIKTIKGAELPAQTALDIKKMDEFLNAMPADFNTVCITVKDSNGIISYNSDIAEAANWNALAKTTIDIKALSAKVKDHGYNLAVRIAVFSDPIAARGDIDSNAIMHSSGVVWIDNTLEKGGKPWTTPYSENVRTYNKNIVAELTQAGADIIILDYMRFPNDPTKSANLKAAEGVSKAEILESFYSEIKQTAGDKPVYVSIGRWILEQGNGDINPVLYGTNPMALEISSWAVETGDTIVLDGSDSEQILPTLANDKEILLIVDAKANSDVTPLENNSYILS